MILSIVALTFMTLNLVLPWNISNSLILSIQCLILLYCLSFWQLVLFTFTAFGTTIYALSMNFYQWSFTTNIKDSSTLESMVNSSSSALTILHSTILHGWSFTGPLSEVFGYYCSLFNVSYLKFYQYLALQFYLILVIYLFLLLFFRLIFITFSLKSMVVSILIVLWLFIQPFLWTVTWPFC